MVQQHRALMSPPVISITCNVINSNGCESSSATIEVIVNDSPAAEAGPDQELNFTFETQMNGLISGSETGEWSIVSGKGNIADIHSPTSKITSLDTGENIFLWTVKNEFCESTDEVKITVLNQFVPNVITPNGDGKNDLFQDKRISRKSIIDNN